jgi:SAM-dependent methyltransferase
MTVSDGAAGRSDAERSYRQHVAGLLAHDDRDSALRKAIGGEWEAIGSMERDLLVAQGLQPDGSVIDVGCGSGRLAVHLSDYLRTGSYLGTDVVPDLLDYARDLVVRPDWSFVLADGLVIPAPDSSADIVCFFSVFTHLRHEESYCYLREARRVLRPSGRIVFSFVEFKIGSHWAIFETNIADIGTDVHLNQFMSRDGIECWARHLELRILEMSDGDVPSIPLAHPVTMESGHRYENLGTLGQSIAVLALK